MDLDTRQLYKRLKIVKETHTYSDKSINEIDLAILEVKKLLLYLNELKEVQKRELVRNTFYLSDMFEEKI